MDSSKQQLKYLENEKQKLAKERDEALEDLKNVETAFSDLHKKYERAKSVVENLKKNEDLLKSRDSAMQESIANKDAQLKKLRQEIQETLERMYADYEAKGSLMEGELMKMKALIRKSEMRISTLENDLEQKKKENQQLHNLCDDLINGEGGRKN